MKVKPSNWFGVMIEFATKNKTRWLMVSVLPDPAPAITTAGARGDSIIGICSCVGTLKEGSTAVIFFAISSAEYLMLINQSPTYLLAVLGKRI